jgi:hypothetical protein
VPGLTRVCKSNFQGRRVFWNERMAQSYVRKTVGTEELKFRGRPLWRPGCGRWGERGLCSPDQPPQITASGAIGCRSSLSSVVNDSGGKSTNDRRTENQDAGACGGRPPWRPGCGRLGWLGERAPCSPEQAPAPTQPPQSSPPEAHPRFRKRRRVKVRRICRCMPM